MISKLLGMRGTEQGLPSPTDDFWYEDASGFQVGGVSPDTAMRLSAVYACVRVLSEGVSALPLKLYQRKKDGGKEVASDHHLYTTLHDMPNHIQSAMEFWEYSMNSLTLRGNAVSLIKGDARVGVTLEPVDIDDVQEVRRVGTDDINYKIRNPASGVARLVDGAKVFHVRGMTSDGVWGVNPIHYHRNAVGLALGAEEFGSAMFKRGVRPSGVIEIEKSLSEPAFKRLRDSFASEYGGASNAAKTVILEDGGKWKQVSMTPEDAQFIDTRKFQLEEIARLFRVPPHMIGDLSRATFSNIEHQSINFVVHTLRPWLVRIEQAIKRDLILQKGKYFAEFTVDGLLRGDIKSRYEAYAVAIQNEILSSNEVRKYENLNPRDGGDEYKNPAINPKGAESTTGPRVTESPAVEDSQASRIIESYVSDIARRISSREVKNMESRVKHASADRGKFNEWMQGFYESHSQLLDSSISGLCDALEVRSTDRLAAVEQLISGSIRDLSGENPQRVVEEWSSGELERRYQSVLKGLAT